MLQIYLYDNTDGSASTLLINRFITVMSVVSFILSMLRREVLQYVCKLSSNIHRSHEKVFPYCICHATILFICRSEMEPGQAYYDCAMVLSVCGMVRQGDWHINVPAEVLLLD